MKFINTHYVGGAFARCSRSYLTGYCRGLPALGGVKMTGVQSWTLIFLVTSERWYTFSLFLTSWLIRQRDKVYCLLLIYVWLDNSSWLPHDNGPSEAQVILIGGLICVGSEALRILSKRIFWKWRNEMEDPLQFIYFWLAYCLIPSLWPKSCVRWLTTVQFDNRICSETLDGYFRCVLCMDNKMILELEGEL